MLKVMLMGCCAVVMQIGCIGLTDSMMTLFNAVIRAHYFSTKFGHGLFRRKIENAECDPPIVAVDDC